MFHEAKIRLAVGCRPVFLGRLEKFIDGQTVPMTVSDIETIMFSLFRQNADTQSEYSRFVGTTPIEDWQNILVDKTKVITALTMYDPEYYSVLGLEPFEANFHYSPDNNPVLFERPGVYEARFRCEAQDQVYPGTVQIIVR